MVSPHLLVETPEQVQNVEGQPQFVEEPGFDLSATDDPVGDLIGADAGDVPDSPSETPTGASAEGDTGGSDATATPPEVPDAPPTEIEIDGKKVPVSEIAELYKGLDDMRMLADAGATYQQALERFNSGIDGAREVIVGMMAAAVEAYGPEFNAADLEGIQTLNPAEFTATERTLYAMARAARAQADQARQEAIKAVEAVKEQLNELSTYRNRETWAETVNKAFPNANATSEQVAAWMREQGVDDPIKAYKLANFGQSPAKASDAPANTTQPPRKPSVPRGGSGGERTFDPNDRNLSIADRVRLMKSGYVPKS